MARPNAHVWRPEVKSNDTSIRMPPVRWLAELCGLPPVAVLPSLATTLLRDDGPATAYVHWWMRHPDRGSQFGEATRHMAEMTDERFLAALIDMGYDALLYPFENDILGHVFFQRHGSDLCAFSASVADRHRGGKLWAVISMDFVAFSSWLAGVRRVRMGAGTHAIGRKMVALLSPPARQLGWIVSPDGWVDFSPARAECPGSDLRAT